MDGCDCGLMFGGRIAGVHSSGCCWVGDEDCGDCTDGFIWEMPASE